MSMSSPSSRLGPHRRRYTTPATPTDDGIGTCQPTPPPGKRPTSSSSSRPESGGSSQRDSVSSRTSLSEIPRMSRQNSLLTPITNEINYDMLPDTAKGATTIGRYHTIVPPINKQETALRPISSRADSIMADTAINLNLSTSDEYNHDDHVINSISEENDPTGTPRLHNPLVNPRYIETPNADLDLTNNNSIETMTPLPEEPEDDEPRIRLAVKLPNGSRIDRYFRPSDHMQAVLNFAAMHEGSLLSGYTLHSRESKYSDMMSTLHDCQISDRTLLLLAPPDR